jgi:hypothetical protein
MTTTDEHCDMCHAQSKLQEAMNCIEDIPAFDVAMFDESILLAFEALEIAYSTLAHYTHEERTP